MGLDGMGSDGMDQAAGKWDGIGWCGGVVWDLGRMH